VSDAWRRALNHLVTVRRRSTSTSASGSSKFAWSDVAANVRCGLQNKGGRMSEKDEGSSPGRRKSAIFGTEAADVIKIGDLLVLENVNPGQTYKVTHVHVENNPNAPHLAVDVEQWAPGAGD
jgi:hypothetical protein